MKILELHPWNVTTLEARAIQRGLRKNIIRSDRMPKIRIVAGADVAFVQPERRSWESGTGRAIAAVVVYRFPEMEEIERVTIQRALTFPYVPGLLSFREIPALVAAFDLLRNAPDVIFCDGQGYAHPIRMGLATHLGMVLDCPTIGCAKSRLTGSYREPGRKAGSWSPLRDPIVVDPDENPKTNLQKRRVRTEVIGAVLRTVDNVRPIFVSSGHRISLRLAIRLVLSVCDGRRIPRPTRDADRLAAAAKQFEKS